MIDKLKARPVNHSRTTLSELMIPSYTNFGGKIHGGTILSIMDKIAYVCATKHAGNYCVTASIDSVDFLSAVEIGSQLSLYASVNYVGKSSLVVGIKVVSEDIKLGIVKHTNTSYFAMVAMDEDHKPIKVPALLLETKEDIRRFLEAKKRRELKKENKSRHDAIKLGDDFECDMEDLLATENCLINLK
ncbi:MAG: acyl-CoA thioesterase [Flavobacteriales bacterium]